jgi:hypothetical protein
MATKDSTTSVAASDAEVEIVSFPDAKMAIALPLVFQFLPCCDLPTVSWVNKCWREQSCYVEDQFYGLLLQRTSKVCVASPPDATKTMTMEERSQRLKKRIFGGRRLAMKEMLPSLWTMEFQQSLGIPSLLESKCDDPAVISTLAWGVRLIYCCGPCGYRELEGAREFPYIANASFWSAQKLEDLRLHGNSVDLELPDDAPPGWKAVRTRQVTVQNHAFMWFTKQKKDCLRLLLGAR